MKIPVLSRPTLEELSQHYPREGLPYKAMFSSLWKAIVLDPRAMLVPIDDHLVHRGDGVFEAFRSYDGAIYDLSAHLERLESSAAGIELPLPYTRQEIKDICLELGQASGCREATFRLYVSRGPGGFTTNPYESIGSQLYIVVTATKPFAENLYQNGVSVGLSRFVTKEPPFCHIKNCNYLINVLMKKEAVDRKLDFTVALDPRGFVAESSTENIALLTKKGDFLAPTFEYKLRGTTLLRCFDLAQEHKSELGLKHIGQAQLRPADFEQAQEVFMIGTTMGVMPVSDFAGVKLTNLGEGSFAARLRRLLQKDILNNSSRRDLY